MSLRHGGAGGCGGGAGGCGGGGCVDYNTAGAAGAGAGAGGGGGCGVDRGRHGARCMEPICPVTRRK
eukprot:scaffold20705_cov66-Skeletonema_marinoi.AAC.1